MNLVIVIVILIVGLAIYFAWRYSQRLPKCVYAHSPNGLNYKWLDHVHGGVSKIMYEEPAGSGNWRDYDDNVWKIHCKVIDHSPEGLVRDHYDSFINPATRFARLHFYFRDGTVMEPTKEFYELEAAWFKKNI